MKINKEFNKKQIELPNKMNIDINIEYDMDKLEEIEDIIYNAMMDNLDLKQDFTPIAEEYEKILDIIVQIENNL